MYNITIRQSFVFHYRNGAVTICHENGAVFMKKNANEIARSLAMITQLGVSMLAPVVLCAVVGLSLIHISCGFIANVIPFQESR